MRSVVSASPKTLEIQTVVVGSVFRKKIVVFKRARIGDAELWP